MKTLLNIKLHLSKKNIFTILVFILVLGGTTCQTIVMNMEVLGLF